MHTDQTHITRRAFSAGAAALAGTALMARATALPAQARASVAAETADWLGEAPAIDEAEVVETVDVDVLVVGAGQSGTPAAYFAATGGAKTLWIEANPFGSRMRQSAIGGIDTKYQQALDITIDREGLLNDVTSYALNQCDMRLWRSWIDNSAEMIDWYGSMVEKAGGRIVLEYTMPPEGRYKTWPVGHGTATMDPLPDNPYTPSPASGDEAAVWEVIRAEFEAAGGEFRANTRLVELIKDGNAVVGAYATNPDGAYVRINARLGVVVATGGYMCNGEMYKALQSDLVKSLVVGSPWGNAKGDGIKALLWAGAFMDDVPSTMVFDRANVRPDYELGHIFDGAPDFNYFHFSSQPFLKVDSTGRRLCNESSPYDYVVHAAQRTPERAWYPIWDSSWQENTIAFMTIGCSTAYTREGSNHHAKGLDGIQGQIDAFIEGGYVIKADTLEELAEALGFETETFLAEVERYNGWAAMGYDGDFGKEAYRLTPIDEPPFYGMKVGGMGLCTLDGIAVNDQYQALGIDGAPIEGAYVVGNDSGRLYAHTYPNFAPGTNAGRCATAGMLVGKALAARA